MLLKWCFQGLPGLSHSLANLCRAQRAPKIQTQTHPWALAVLVRLLKASAAQLRSSWGARKDLRCCCGSTGSRKERMYSSLAIQKGFQVFIDYCVPCEEMAPVHTNRIETAFTKVSDLILQLLWVVWGGFWRRRKKKQNRKIITTPFANSLSSWQSNFKLKPVSTKEKKFQTT